MGIFAIAATQAIGEILQRHGSAGKFGWVFSEQELAHAAQELCAFFEMSINLRQSALGRASQGRPDHEPTPGLTGHGRTTEQPASSSRPLPFSESLNPENGVSQAPLSPTLTGALPRKARIPFTDKERGMAKS